MEHRHIVIKSQKDYVPKERMRELEGLSDRSVILLSGLLGEEIEKTKKND